jgi:hypothetical protein
LNADSPMTSRSSGFFPLLNWFTASTVEFVEARAIVLGAGLVLGRRPACKELSCRA